MPLPYSSAFATAHGVKSSPLWAVLACIVWAGLFVVTYTFGSVYSFYLDFSSDQPLPALTSFVHQATSPLQRFPLLMLLLLAVVYLSVNSAAAFGKNRAAALAMLLALLLLCLVVAGMLLPFTTLVSFTN